MCLPSEWENPHVFSEIKEIFVELVEPSNPYGQLRSAEIIVEGPLVPIQPLEGGDIVTQSRGNPPERFSDHDDLFALFFATWDHREIGNSTYGLVLTKVSEEIYRRVRLIDLTPPTTSSNSPKLEFSKIDTCRVRII
jgi:hypothetical protein